MFRCVAACCSVLQCVAVCCSGLQYAPNGILDLNTTASPGYAGVLQCVAVCCSVLQCVAVYCSVLQYAPNGILDLNTAASPGYAGVLQSVAVCCSLLQGGVLQRRLDMLVLPQCVVVYQSVMHYHCVAVSHSVLHCVAACCSMLQYVAVCCSTSSYVALSFTALQCSQHSITTSGCTVSHNVLQECCGCVAGVLQCTTSRCAGVLHTDAQKQGIVCCRCVAGVLQVCCRCVAVHDT